MSGPIRELEDGAKRIGSGQFDHRIALSSGDELEKLATRFNEMAGELAISKQKSERINRLKRFLAPQVAELVENSDGLLDGQRREVVAVFADLRGFTAFSARAEPEIIIAALQEYYEAVGAVITRHEATLIQFAGDGVMILLNAPVACADPAIARCGLRSTCRRRFNRLRTGGRTGAMSWVLASASRWDRRRWERSDMKAGSTTRRSEAPSTWPPGCAIWPVTRKS